MAMVSAPTVASEEITLALPTDLLGWIDELAAEKQRTRNELIERAARYYVSTLRWRAAQAVIAPAARAAGLLTEDDIEEYMDSLPDEPSDSDLRLG